LIFLKQKLPREATGEVEVGVFRIDFYGLVLIGYGFAIVAFAILGVAAVVAGSA
jgi:hypothetical protein